MRALYESVIKRNISTTRMRDFYDLYNLYNLRKEDYYLKKLWKVYLADNLYVGDLNFLETIKVVELIAEEIAL